VGVSVGGRIRVGQVPGVDPAMSEECTARRVAREVVRHLRCRCVRCKVAGAIRRGEERPERVTICYVPWMREVQGLQEPVSETAARIEELVRQGFWAWDEEWVRRGPRQQRLVREGVVVELFRAERENWGAVLAIRTGPADLNRLVMLAGDEGGMPRGMEMREGWLWKAGRRVETWTEREYWEALELPMWPPETRSAHRMRRWLRRARRAGR